MTIRIYIPSNKMQSAMKAPKVFHTNTTCSTDFSVDLQKKLQHVRSNHNYRKLDIC